MPESHEPSFARLYASYRGGEISEAEWIKHLQELALSERPDKSYQLGRLMPKDLRVALNTLFDQLEAYHRAVLEDQRRLMTDTSTGEDANRHVQDVFSVHKSDWETGLKQNATIFRDLILQRLETSLSVETMPSNHLPSFILTLSAVLDLLDQPTTI